MAKSMQDFWKIDQTQLEKNRESLKVIHHWSPKNAKSVKLYLIFVYLSILKLSLTLFLEGDDDEGHKDVDKEEWENDKEDDVENRHLDPEKRNGPLVLVSGCH